MAKFTKGHIPWHKGRTGVYTEETLQKIGESKGFTGRKHTEETKRKMSIKRKGIIFSKEHCKNISKWHKGRVLSEKHKQSISKSIRKCGGYKRTAEHLRKLGLAHKGKKCHFWHGGLFLGGYGIGFNKKLKSEIRNRDNYTCQECGYTEKQLGYTLSIHHIDYDKNNHDKINLVALCKSCHAKTSYNRNDWIEYYSKKVLEVG